MAKGMMVLLCFAVQVKLIFSLQILKIYYTTERLFALDTYYIIYVRCAIAEYLRFKVLELHT